MAGDEKWDLGEVWEFLFSALTLSDPEAKVDMMQGAS